MKIVEHPGKLIKKIMDINVYGIAKQLKILPDTARKLFMGKLKITEELARRISYMMQMYSVEPKKYQTTNYWLKINEQYYKYVKQAKNK